MAGERHSAIVSFVVPVTFTRFRNIPVGTTPDCSSPGESFSGIIFLKLFDSSLSFKQNNGPAPCAFGEAFDAAAARFPLSWPLYKRGLCSTIGTSQLQQLLPKTPKLKHELRK